MVKRSAEKNDVDISALFKWGKPVTLEDKMTKQSITVYLRLVGDAELGRAKTYGYRQAARLRKSLRTPDTDERDAFLAELTDYDDVDLLVQTVILLELPAMYRDSSKEAFLKEPQEPPDGEDQEAWEIYQENVDTYEDRHMKAVEEMVNKATEKRKKELKKLPEEEVYKLYEGGIINRLCEEDLNKAYYDQCVYFGTYSDEKHTKKVFKNFEAYENVATEVKTALHNAYKDLEIGVDFLKKSPEATE